LFVFFLNPRFINVMSKSVLSCAFGVEVDLL